MDAIGEIEIAIDDTRLKRLMVADVKLLKKAVKPFLKSSKLVEIGIYPHNDGGYALMFRDSCSRDANTWIALCPIVWDGVE